MFEEDKGKTSYFLLIADKSGGFVVVPQGMFCEKTREAVFKNFKSRSGVLSEKEKMAAERLWDSLNLTGLSKSVSLSEGKLPPMFLSSKRH